MSCNCSERRKRLCQRDASRRERAGWLEAEAGEGAGSWRGDLTGFGELWEGLEGGAVASFWRGTGGPDSLWLGSGARGVLSKARTQV